MKAVKKEYEEAILGLEQYGSTVCSIITEVLRQSNIQVHSVNYRVKDIKSVSMKVSMRPGQYKTMDDLTDLLGIRVITYFPRDVDKVAKALEKELTVDKKNTIDKRKLLDLDKFGYLSLHYVVSLSKSRNDLVEYRRFSKLHFEIQIRSILQHAWAEIEHDLGYKAEGSIPDEMRRSFSRLAGLLELADEEFERIRDGLGAYEDHVNATIEKAPQTLMIDQSTVVAALQKEDVLIELDKVVALAGNAKLTNKITPEYVGGEAKQLKILGIRDINHLLRFAKSYKAYVQKFAEYWMADDPDKDAHSTFSRGIGLFYLCYVIVAQVPESRVADWNTALRDSYPEILDEVNEAWAKVVNDLGEPTPSLTNLLPT